MAIHQKSNLAEEIPTNDEPENMVFLEGNLVTNKNTSLSLGETHFSSRICLTSLEKFALRFLNKAQ